MSRDADDVIAWLREMRAMPESPDVRRIGELRRRRVAQQARRRRERES